MTSAHTSSDQRIFYKECMSLAASGYETYLVAPGESRIDSGVQVIGVGGAPKKRLQRMISFAQKIYKRALDLDCDIYHFHDPELLPFGLKLKRKGKTVIFDSHENYSMQITEKKYIASSLRTLIAAGYKRYEMFVLKRVDAVIIPCTFEGKNIFERIAKKTCFIGNFPIYNDRIGQSNPQKDKKLYICHVGVLTYERGIAQLIEAAYLAKVRLVLAGRFSNPSFEGEMQALSAFSNVEYRGVVSPAEVAQINGRALAGACTILHIGQYGKIDTLATKVYEYMAMGLPVILSDYPYARKVMEKYSFGIRVDPADSQAIADAIIYLREHSEEARHMGEEGRRAVEQEFNWQGEERKLLGLYQELSKALVKGAKP